MPHFRSCFAATRLAMLGLPLAVSVAAAQQPPALQPGMTHSSMPGMAMSDTATPTSPSSQAFKDANERMMKGMNGPLSGNADQDFVAGMIPHHQGAIDMAKIELQYGKDPQLRRLAQAIIGAQQKEIAEMRTWQNKHKP